LSHGTAWRLFELDKSKVGRFEDFSTLSNENKNFVLNMIDMALRDFKTKRRTLSKGQLIDL